MKTAYREIALVIPSLEPLPPLVPYVQQLLEQGFRTIIVVNDGSDASYDPIFQQVEGLGCTLLRHPKNLGKGAALKTAYQHIQDTLSHCAGVVTVDSDGQHAVEDVCQLVGALPQHPGSLLLGCRDFSLPDIPKKSRFGNRVSSFIFFAFHGKWLGDTQTGLRAFDSSLLPHMLEIPGVRFEYEMQVLTDCVSRHVPLHTQSIRTIYDNNNVGTHFQPLADSLRILKVLFGKFGRFLLSSLSSAVIDIAIAWFLFDFLVPYIPDNDLLRIGAATVSARLISMTYNFLVNKFLVFSEQKKSVSFPRYLALCILIMTLSTLGSYAGFHFFGFAEKLVKLCVDPILFLLSYQLQRLWVFRGNGKG